MKAIIAGLVWTLYTLSINVYILTFEVVSPFASKLIYLTAGFITLLFCIVNILNNFSSSIHRALVCLILGSIALNFLLLLAYYLIGMVDYKWNFCIFNGIEFITACFLLHSGKKRGLFINETK